MELLEGQLAAGQIDRKWRLFLCACARRAVQASGTVGAESLLAIPERFADGEVDAELLSHARDRLQARLPSHGHPIELADHAIAAACGTTYPSRTTQLFSATCQNLDCAAYAAGDEDLGWTAQAAVMKDIFGNPFRPVGFDPGWRTSTAVALAKGMYESRDFSPMPILADALQDAGCDSDDILNHCRDATAAHIRGCWVVDLVLGKA
jgi:hypothetical protein